MNERKENHVEDFFNKWKSQSELSICFSPYSQQFVWRVYWILLSLCSDRLHLIIMLVKKSLPKAIKQNKTKTNPMGNWRRGTRTQKHSVRLSWYLQSLMSVVCWKPYFPPLQINVHCICYLQPLAAHSQTPIPCNMFVRPLFLSRRLWILLN